ncbi:MAG TPA: PilZ domain-containing protein [Candidatus Limnocylindrales bacterium]|nr:PilZ domain-containing protein [Candidatus Limnocylindrales bacterium]
MPEVTVERRGAPRYPMVLAADVVELPRGARLSARTSDISRTGCYVDTLNPVPQGSKVRLRITHHDEVFEAIGRVVYVSYGLGMGVAFENVTPEEQAKLDRWIEDPDREF